MYYGCRFIVVMLFCNVIVSAAAYASDAFISQQHLSLRPAHFPIIGGKEITQQK
jgi:hypothetical protein